MSDPYQAQLDTLTKAIELQEEMMRKNGAVFMQQIDRLAARVELLNALLIPLLGHADPIAKSAAIASAQVKGERLQEQGPAAIAANYSQLLASMFRE